MDYSKMKPLLVEAINTLSAKYEEKFAEQEEHTKELESRIQELARVTAEVNN